MTMENKWFRMFFSMLFAAAMVPSLCLAGANDDDDDDSGDPCGGDANSVSLSVPCGQLAHGSIVSSAFLVLEEHQPSALTVTPQALNLVIGGYGGYSMKSAVVKSGGSREISFIAGAGKLLRFTVASGANVGYPVGNYASDDERLLLRDATGALWDGTGKPAFYEIKENNGDFYRFVADDESNDFLNLSSVKKDGREQSLFDIGLFVVRDELILRQIKTPSRLMDIVTETDSRYRIDIYTTKEVNETPNANGMYEPYAGSVPMEKWIVQNPDTNNINHVTLTRNIGYSETEGDYTTKRVSDYTYLASRNEWSVSKDGGVTYERIAKELVTGQDKKVETREVGKNGVVQFRQTDTRKFFSWGSPVVEKKKYIDAQNAITTSYTYYDDSTDAGSYKQKKMMSRSDGYWERFEYDSEGRLSKKISPFGSGDITSSEAQSRVTEYDYTLLDSVNEPVEFNDTRPRTVTEKTLGVVTKKTFYSYPVINNERHEIEQVCLDKDAAYKAAAPWSSTDKLIRVKSFYTSVTNQAGYVAHKAGRLKSVRHPDGLLDSYDYEKGTYTVNGTSPGTFSANSGGTDWREIVTHGTEASSAGIATKSLQEVRVWNKYGDEVLRETRACNYNGSTYDRINWVVAQHDDLGHPVNVYYSDGTQVSGVWGTGCCGKDSGTDRYGIQTAFVYDDYKRLTSMSRAAGGGVGEIATEYVLDGKGRRLSETRLGGSLSLVSTNSYDWMGRKLWNRNESDLETFVDYNDVARKETTTFPGGATRIVEKNADETVRSITGTAVVQETYSYGVNSNGTRWETKFLGSNGAASLRWEKTTIDMAGRVEKTEKPAFGGGTLEVVRQYNAKGKLEKQIETAPGTATETTFYEYDLLGNLFRTGQDANGDGVLTVNSMDRIAETDFAYSDGKKYTWAMVYSEDNGDGYVTTQVRIDELVSLGGTETGYSGKLAASVSTTDRFNQTTIHKTFIDRANAAVVQVADLPVSTNDQVQVVINGFVQTNSSAQAVVQTYSYDDLGRRTEVSSVSDGGSRSVTSITHYNARNQIDYTEDAAGNRITYTYDPDSGRKDTQVNALTNTAYYAYDLRGNVTNEWGSTYPVEYEFDSFSQLHKLRTFRDEAGAPDVTTWLYDEATGLMTNKVYADNKGTTYDYWPDGKLKTRSWERGETTDYAFDTLGQLTNINYSASVTPDIDLVYNRMGQRLSADSTVAAYEYQYALNGMLTNETVIANGITNVITRSVDTFGRPTGYDLLTGGTASSQSVDYGYDSLGRFSVVTSSVASVNSVVDYFWMDGANLLNGYSTAGISPALSVSYAYETNRDYKTNVTNRAGTDLISSFDYVYDAHGRRTDRTDKFESNTPVDNKFGYNERDEVTMAKFGTDMYRYYFDDIGNRDYIQELTPAQRQYTANELNQYTEIQGVANTHDDGNLTDDGKWSYEWNGENRLMAMESLSLTNGATRLEFTYDYMGRRISKKLFAYNGSSFDPERTSFFLYDGWNLISETEFNPQSEVVSRQCYTWGLDLTKTLQGAGGVGGLLSQTSINSTTNTYYPVCDANGNVSDYVDAFGNVVAHFEYDAFGRVTDETIASGLDGRLFALRFSSKYEDVETDLNYYGFRFYGAEMGRWLNRDPIGERGGVNIFRCTHNDLVNFIDILGLEEDPCCEDGEQIDCDELLDLIGDQYELFQDLSEALGDLLDDQYDTLLDMYGYEQLENIMETLAGAAVGAGLGNAWRAGTASSLGQGGSLSVDLARSGVLTGGGISSSAGFDVAAGSAGGVFVGEQLAGLIPGIPDLMDTDGVNDMMEDGVQSLDDMVDQLNDALGDNRDTYRSCCQ